MVRDTGSPRVDAEIDFARVRRHQTLSKLATWMRSDPDIITETLSFNDVVDALGRRGEHRPGRAADPARPDRRLGRQGARTSTAGSGRPPTAAGSAGRRLAEKSRLGEYLPPIDVYKLGNLYFVIDGHHRVSVARAQGATEIEAHVTEIDTVIDTEGIGGRRDLEGKNWGLRFLKRVPLTGERRAAINCTDPTDYPRLAEMIEAWACRLMHDEGAYFDQETMAQRWFDEEYTPVVEMIDEAGVRGRDETGADAYIRVAGERYRLIREHDWNRDVMRMVAEQPAPSSSGRRSRHA